MASRKGAAAPGFEDEDEICPICKSSRYLNPTMTFLINDCYHKMCASCVSRRFGLGPAECPYPNCKAVLRKHKFRAQTFPDLRVEREVDVRRKVSAVFNRRAEDFTTLREYNDYLEDVERITFEMLDEDPKVRFRAEKELQEQAVAHKKIIAQNLEKDREDKESVLSRAEMQRKQTLAARKAAALEIEDQKKEQEEIKRIRVRILAETRNPAEARKRIADETRKIKVRREAARERTRREVEEEFGGGGGKRRRIAEEEAFEPAKGMEWESRWFVVREDYDDVPWLDDTKNDEATLAGGFFLSQYFERSLFEAFSGFTISIGEEMEKAEAEKAKTAPEDNIADRPVIVQDIAA